MPDDASSESEPEQDDEPTDEEPEEQPEEEDEDDAGAGPLVPGDAPGWDSAPAPEFDKHMQERMELRWASNMNPSIKNAGEDYAQLRATPKAPRDGWYNERYVCATLKMEDMDEEELEELLVRVLHLGDDLLDSEVGQVG